jgi:hypothetical protein
MMMMTMHHTLSISITDSFFPPMGRLPFRPTTFANIGTTVALSPLDFKNNEALSDFGAGFWETTNPSGF